VSNEPSWWKYIGGRDADRMWTRAFVCAMREGRPLSQEDRTFYLAAVERLELDQYQVEAHRHKERRIFWLACYYWLCSLTTEHGIEAALTTIQMAHGRDIDNAHSKAKTLERQAKALAVPVRDFLDEIVRMLRADSDDAPRQNARLMEWIATKVQEVS
jgi:hypothetical protein